MSLFQVTANACVSFSYQRQSLRAYIFMSPRGGVQLRRPTAPPASLCIRQCGLAKQPWTDFLFNLPPKETEWDTPHITIGWPYNMEIGAEWNSRGTRKQAPVVPTRGSTHTLLMSLRSVHDPRAYVVDSLKPKCHKNTLLKSPIIHLSGSVPLGVAKLHINIPALRCLIA